MIWPLAPPSAPRRGCVGGTAAQEARCHCMLDSGTRCVWICAVCMARSGFCSIYSRQYLWQHGNGDFCAFDCAYVSMIICHYLITLNFPWRAHRNASRRTLATSPYGLSTLSLPEADNRKMAASYCCVALHSHPPAVQPLVL